VLATRQKGKENDMKANPAHMFFCGSIPLEHEVDVFTTLSDIGGERLRRVPDGELGDRKMWVIGQYAALAASPALQFGAFPADGLTRRTCYQIPLELRPGKTESDIVFDDLGYARHALSSYGLFCEMKKAGRIPASWRLQVNLPTPSDVMPMIEAKTKAAAEKAYKKALLSELEEIQEHIPHQELAITWDVVHAVLTWEDPDNKYIKQFFADPKNDFLRSLVELGQAVAPDVELGYHLCYGSQDHKHALEPRDLSACVTISNDIAAKLGRRMDYVHMPVPRERIDDAYFKPLASLDRQHIGEVYLGLVHYTDGVDGARRRIAAAEKYLPEFGIAAECGFGRRPSHQDVMRLIQLHADIIDSTRGA
jgi:hypothetical protein